MDPSFDYIPSKINSGPWLTSYTLNKLLQRVETDKIVLPICSLGTPLAQLHDLAPLVLPPLYHEALDPHLRGEILDRVGQCFPFYQGTQSRKTCPVAFEIIELPRQQFTAPQGPKILGFSVDTAVEEHGPHLPLATDTIQSYSVLQQLRTEYDGFMVGAPVDYGHLTWGLPFGLSIDLTPELVTRYVAGFANAVQTWMQPASLYVVDVHGSIVHRTAIQEGLRRSRVDRWLFRWLHEPLVEFAGDRGDQHAGGVETALVELINPQLTDSRWWPAKADDLADRQMDMDQAVQLSADLPRFIKTVEDQAFNGIVGDIRNYFELDASLMMSRMLDVARQDVEELRVES